MPTARSPRKGSLQFWPRKRVSKYLPRVNWNRVNTSSTKNLKGFITYKAGMVSGFVLDNTADSMTKGKKIIIPLTILECPKMRIFSVRFYKNNQVVREIVSKNVEKEMKKKVKLPKKDTEKLEEVKPDTYDDIRVIFYSLVKETGIKKTPDLTEIDLTGSVEEKMNFVKENLHKEISALDIFEKGQLVDIRGVTKGKGLQGPVKRFGIALKVHKSEKGQRRPGSLGPWHPARVTFRVPISGQMGTFTRVAYNNKIIDLGDSKGKDEEKFKNIKNYGNLKTDYILIRGSVPGPAKRQILLTPSFRETKKQAKRNFQLIELR